MISKIIKDLYFLVVLLGFVLLIIIKWDEVKTIFLLFERQNSVFLVVALAMQVLTYIVTALTYQSILIAISSHVPFSFLFKSSFSMLSLNQIVPSLGFSGGAFFVSRVKKFGISSGKATLSMVMESVIFYSSFIILLFLGVLYLFIAHKVAYVQILLSLAFLIIMFICVFYFFYVLKSKEHFSRVLYRIYFFIYVKILKKKEDRKGFDFLVSEFFIGKDMMLKNKYKFIAPFVYSILKSLFDILTIYFVFLAFGYNANLGVLTVGFCLATLLSYISFIPGGIGVFEFSMAGIFAGFGILFSLGFIVTLIFRGLAFWLPIPIGLWFYKELK